jgi:hypothetical protein
MRGSLQRSLPFALAAVAIAVASEALAQADAAPPATASAGAEQPEEVTVTGRKTMAQYRLELERARNDIIRIFNDANEGTDNDMRCRAEQPTGRRIKQTVCRSQAEDRAHAEAGRAFLNALFSSTQGFNTHGRLGFGSDTPPPMWSGQGAGDAQQSGKVGEGDALAAFEKEWQRLLSENRDLFNAVTTYATLDAEYAQARGATTGAALQDVTLLEVAALPAQASGPVCEASTLTEYSQRNNVALVSGTVSISGCPAGTTGSFTVVARVRDDAGNANPLEFNETWQRADAADHVFKTEYPIGDGVFLSSVRVRNLECSCAAPAQ